MTDANITTIHLTDINTYNACVEHMLLYWYKSYITLYDGTNEIMLQKSNITYIYNKYSDSDGVYTQNTNSTIYFKLQDGSQIKCNIRSTPNIAPGITGGISKYIISSDYVIDDNISTYTNGSNTTQNAYKNISGSVVIINGRNIGIYTQPISFYDALETVGVNFKSSSRQDKPFDSNVNSTEVKSHTLGGVPGCVLQFEADSLIQTDSSNIALWTDQVNKVSLQPMGTAVLDNTRLASNGILPITMTGDHKSMFATNIPFSSYGIPQNDDDISICWVGNIYSNAPNTNVPIISLGELLNSFKTGYLYSNKNMLFYTNDNSINVNDFITFYPKNVFISVPGATNGQFMSYCVTMQRTSANLGKLMFYINKSPVSDLALADVPHKINPGSILVKFNSCSNDVTNTALLGLYVFNKCLTQTDINNFHDGYIQYKFGSIPASLQSEYSGVVRFESDYGIKVTDNGNSDWKNLTWKSKISNITLTGTGIIITTPTGFPCVLTDISNPINSINSNNYIIPHAPYVNGTSQTHVSRTVVFCGLLKHSFTTYTMARMGSILFNVVRPRSITTATTDSTSRTVFPILPDSGNQTDTWITYIYTQTASENTTTTVRIYYNGVEYIPQDQQPLTATFKDSSFSYVSLSTATTAAFMSFNQTFSADDVTYMHNYLKNKYIG